MKYFKSVLLGGSLIFLIAFFFLSHEIVWKQTLGDITGDNQIETVVLTKKTFSKYGKDIIIYSSDNEEIYREDFSELKPWKVAIGDVDGDGIDDISIGVYKETLFHPVMAKRPFIYSFEDENLQPKWRGSRLSKPFIDYIFYDIDEDKVDELISIEIINNGDKVINTYKWKGFGFEGIAESKAYEDIYNLHIEDNLIYIEYKEEDKKLKGFLKYNDYKLTIERVINSDW